MNLGEVIKKYRKEKKYSIYNLAKEVGISPSYINQIEHGKKRNPDNAILIKISLALNIPFKEIIILKIKELEEILYSNEDESKVTAYRENSLIKKLFLLDKEELTKLENYVDSLLDSHTNNISQ